MNARDATVEHVRFGALTTSPKVDAGANRSPVTIVMWDAGADETPLARTTGLLREKTTAGGN